MSLKDITRKPKIGFLGIMQELYDNTLAEYHQAAGGLCPRGLGSPDRCCRRFVPQGRPLP